MAFDAQNHLVFLTVNGQTTHFIYDGDGNLVVKYNPDNTSTVYIGSVYEVNRNDWGGVSGTTTYYPAVGAMRVNGTLYYVLKDKLGSASVVLNDTGGIVGETHYYPFGETRETAGSLLTDRLFTGQREMAGLGLYHYGARFYSPELGRFIQLDMAISDASNPQSFNRFSYVNNNPIKFTDPSGHYVCYIEVGGSCYGYASDQSPNAAAIRAQNPKTSSSTPVEQLSKFAKEIKKNSPTGDPLKDFKLLVKYAQFEHVNDKNGFMSDLTCVINGWCDGKLSPKLLFLKPFINSMPNPSYIGPNAFRGQGTWSSRYYDYTDNQMYHFWYFVALTYYDNVAIASVGNVFHEGFGDDYQHWFIPPSMLPEVQSAEEVSRSDINGSSKQDYLLSDEGIRLGLKLRVGEINIDEVADWIYEHLSE